MHQPPANCYEEIIYADPDRGCAHGAIAIFGGMVGGSLSYAAVETVEAHTAYTTTDSTTQHLELPADTSTAELGGAIGGFVLSAAAVYIGIRRIALRHMTLQRYKELKCWQVELD